MDSKELILRRKFRDDFAYYAPRCLKITPKTGSLVPFHFNHAQIYLHNQIEQQRLLTKKVRIIVVKGRQQGMSTYFEGRLYWRITHKYGVRAFILTHENSATDNLFDMSKRYHDNCPAQLKPSTSASSSKELFFGVLDSGYKVGTASNKAVGRSGTIQFLHGSEVAYWENAAEHAKGIMQCVPNAPDTEVYLESTANGVGNYFHEQWQLAVKGESEFLPIFIPWFMQRDYVYEVPEGFALNEDEHDLVGLYDLTPPQLMWRRVKIKELSAGGMDGAKSFLQEYPCNSVEAFTMSGEDTLINADIAYKAMKSDCEGVGPLIVGCDPARYGDDRTSIIYRRGRKAYNLKSYSKKDTMEIVGILHIIIKQDNPDYVCIDVGGLGAGIVDRLIELGYGDIIKPINSGSKPLNAEKYVNKRAEMWGELNAWLHEVPCEIPDQSSLHEDLCSVKYSYDSQSRLVIESKEKMKKRGIKSPDEAEALGLTFAIVATTRQNNKQKSESVARDMMSYNRRLQRLRTANR